MPPTKLTDRDKQEILVLYRNSDETTSTIADRYGVSSSSISRFLKKTLSREEYDELISQKRFARGSKTENSSIPEEISTVESSPIIEARSTNIEEVTSPPPKPDRSTVPTNIEDREVELMDIVSLEEMLGEELDDLDEDIDDVAEDIEQTSPPPIDKTVTLRTDKKTPVKILPLDKAPLDQTCYVVIDRAANLITKPMLEFNDLGEIPPHEQEQVTLPVFDSTRVAKRFLRNPQRIVRVPDGNLVRATSAYLTAKGITRILLDGQVFSLVDR